MTAAWAALLRLARRDVGRHPGRAALVVILIALPVAGMVAAGTLRSSVQPTPPELATRELGSASLVVYHTDSAVDDARMREQLPGDAVVEPLWRGTLTLTSPTGVQTVEALGVDLDGLGEGMVEIVRGRAPQRGTEEIAVAGILAQSMGWEIGGLVETELGSARIVGLVRDRVTLNRQLVVVPPDRALGVSGVLVDLPANAHPAEVARKIEGAGWDVVTRDDLARPDTEQTVMNRAMAGFAFLYVSLVAAAAFAVSAQRRRHDLALLAACGADARHLRRSILASALVLGGGGAVVGAVVGVGVSAGTLPWLEGWTNRAVDGLVVEPLLLLAAMTTGIVASVGASWFTAVTAGRTPVAAALTGRGPAGKSSVRLLVVGIVGIGLGSAVILATTAAATGSDPGGELLVAGGLLAGATLTMLGLGALSPWLVERLLALVGTRLPVGVRIALRDTARFRSRTGPIVMAIVAGLGLSVAVGATLDTIEAGLEGEYRPWLAEDQMLVDGAASAPFVDELRDRLPIEAAAPFTSAELADTSGTLPPVIMLADGRLLDALGAPDTAREALESGQVLVLQDSAKPEERQPLVDQAELLAPDGVHIVELDIVPRAVVSIILTRDTLDRSGADITREGTSWLLRLAAPATDQQVAQARQLAADTQQRITVETGPPEIASGTIQTVMLVATGLLSLLIVAIGLALMTAETRQDDAVLSSVGASPGTRRSVAAARAGALTLLGAILAVPAGLVPIWGLSTSTIVGPAAVQLTIPFMTIAAVVLLVPGIAATGAYLLTRPEPATITARPTT